jgi:hypothetical protein
MAAKQGRNVLFCVPSRTSCVLLVSMMNLLACWSFGATTASVFLALGRSERRCVSVRFGRQEPSWCWAVTW